jgi:Amt family ammonium transporter
LFYGNPDQFLTQIGASLLVIVFSFVVTYVIAKVLDAVMGIRVSKNAEEAGLDISEHAERAYS